MMAINRYRLRALERTGHRGARLASELLRRTDGSFRCCSPATRW